MMAAETSRWHVQDFLTDDVRIAESLAATFEDGDPALIRAAIGVVAKARGMSSLARETGITREALYKALGEKGNPTLDTLTKVMRALGLKLGVTA
jgi:probable addiction module antidote protein